VPTVITASDRIHVWASPLHTTERVQRATPVQGFSVWCTIRPLRAIDGGDAEGSQLAARVLVAYATKLGSNGEIAEVIATALCEAGHDAVALPARALTARLDCDAVVLGSALYAAQWRKDAHRFIARHRDELATRPLWLFSSGPLDATLAAQDLPPTVDVMIVTAGLRSRGHRTFGGRLSADAAVDPQILATHRIGDFRDWDAIRAWALSIGEALDGPTSA
jgi:menaquinone-dependent protoporphyrinogen oxidase